AFAVRLDRKLRQLIPYMLRESRSSVQHALQTAEELCAEIRFLLEVRNKQFPSLRDIQVKRRRNFAKVLDRSSEQLRRRFSIVYVQSSSVIQNQSDIVAAAERMIPGSPIQKHGRLVPQES